MKIPFTRRILSVFLAMVLLLSCCPAGYAAEVETEPVPVMEETEILFTEETENIPVETNTETTEVPAGTDADTEPAQQTEAAEETISVETVPEDTAPVETVPEATIPKETSSEETVPEETILEETIPAETEAELLFPGLPEDYILSEEEQVLKQSLIERRLPESLVGMTAGENYVEGEIIVRAESEEEAQLKTAAFGGELRSWGHGTAVVGLLNGTVAEAVTAALDPEQHLPAAEVNYLARQIPVESSGMKSMTVELPERMDWASWARDTLKNPDPRLLNPENDPEYQWMHDAVDSYAAWGVTTGASWVNVAVIDSGVYASHEELSGRVRTINIGYGTSCADSHGTHVAGIIAGALDNGKGGAGIAPGVSIISIRACDDEGSFPFKDVADAIYEAVYAGAHIINMSLGGSGYAYYLQDAIDYAVDCGVTVIAAMGNAGTNAMDYPAAHDGVIAVAASDETNSRAFFSNYGAWADIAAPGEGILSSVVGGYDLYNGTSMASPVVAGAAALYMSAVGHRVDPATMEKVLESSATKMKDSGCGAGVVNVANMLDGVPAAPYYRIVKDGVEYSAKDPIPYGAEIHVYENEDAYWLGRPCDENGVFLWSFDGKAPSVKNGQKVHGVALPENTYVINEMADVNSAVKVAYVSGMGIMGKVLSLNLKMVRNDEISSITIQGPSQLIPGKSCTLTATVYPLESADQKVTWKLVSSSISGAKIDQKTGKLSAPAGKTGTITVQATSVADSSIYQRYTVKVENINPVAKITLNKTSVTVFVGATGSVRVSSMVDSKGNPVSRSVQWSSSNPKILTVDANGNFTAVGKGSANIVCTALDGSGKKAQCKVTVAQQVLLLAANGQRSIAPGSSATYKVTVYYPSTASNKKVTWSIPDAPSGVTIDAKSGKVTVGKYVPEETSFEVVATAADGYGATTSCYVTVRSKCTGIYISCDGYYGYASGVTWDKKGWVKTVNLFSMDLEESTYEDNKVQLDYRYTGPANDVAYIWESSAPDVVTVTQWGEMTAHKAGTAKITLTALDGSNKKASCTINVTNPSSTISISSNAPRMTTSEYYLAFGKSDKNTAVFANTYGKPSNQKVNWSYRVYQLNTDGSLAYDRTSTFSSNKLITLNASGSLSVKSGAQKYWTTYSRRLIVRVTATATDGTGASSYIDYNLIPQTTVIIPEGKNWWSYAYYRGTSYYFWSDQWYGFNASFTATSSNPKVASVMEGGVFFDGYDSEMGLNRYVINVAHSGLTGSTNITIKAADGSNKSCSFSLKLY